MGSYGIVYQSIQGKTLAERRASEKTLVLLFLNIYMDIFTKLFSHYPAIYYVVQKRLLYFMHRFFPVLACL